MTPASAARELARLDRILGQEGSRLVRLVLGEKMEIEQAAAAKKWDCSALPNGAIGL